MMYHVSVFLSGLWRVALMVCVVALMLLVGPLIVWAMGGQPQPAHISIGFILIVVCVFAYLVGLAFK